MAVRLNHLKDRYPLIAAPFCKLTVSAFSTFESTQDGQSYPLFTLLSALCWQGLAAGRAPVGFCSERSCGNCPISAAVVEQGSYNCVIYNSDDVFLRGQGFTESRREVLCAKGHVSGHDRLTVRNSAYAPYLNITEIKWDLPVAVL
jgi:hypothetical protein